MVQEGYAAVSTRRVAKDAALAPALVHYYFPTTDDLFVALHRRMTERQLEELRTVLASDEPLRSLWAFQTGWAQASLGVEFMALANHRKAIRRVIARRTEQARDAQADLLQRSFIRPRALPDACNPLSLSTLLMGLARTLVNEEAIGIRRGHAELRALVEWALGQLSAEQTVERRK
jgi:AcrR family transcriptional regulator